MCPLQGGKEPLVGGKGDGERGGEGGRGKRERAEAVMEGGGEGGRGRERRGEAGEGKERRKGV